VHGTAHLGATQTLDTSMQLEPPPAGETGSTVVLDSSSFEARQYPVVFGEVDGVGPVTLVDVSGLHWNAPFPVDQSWNFRYAISGKRLPDSRLAFDRFSFSTDRLWDWAAPAGVDFSGGPDGTTFRMPSRTMLDCPVGAANLQLVSRPSVQVDSPRVAGELVAAFEVEVHSPVRLLDAVDEWIGPLRDLISLLSSRPNRLTRIAVGLPDEQEWHDVHIWLPGDDLPTSQAALRPDYQLAPLRSIEDPSAAVGAWLLHREAFRLVRANLLAGGSPAAYEEYRAANLVHAAEACHRLLWDRPGRPAAEHQQRVEAVVASAPDEYREWLRTVLTPANELGLRLRLQDITDEAVKAGMPMFPDERGEFAREIVAARDRSWHAGVHQAPEERERIYRLLQGLDWMLKAILLSQLHMPSSTVASRLAHNTEFVTLAAELGWRPASG
jgi:hypothetical protein